MPAPGSWSASAQHSALILPLLTPPLSLQASLSLSAVSSTSLCSHLCPQTSPKPLGFGDVKKFYFTVTKAMAPHSSTLAWKIPWTEEPARLQSMGSLGVGHD